MKKKYKMLMPIIDGRACTELMAIFESDDDLEIASHFCRKSGIKFVIQEIALCSKDDWVKIFTEKTKREVLEFWKQQRKL